MTRTDELDRRFTLGLIDDVFRALERAGYRCTTDVGRGHAIEVLGELVLAYEGDG